MRRAVPKTVFFSVIGLYSIFLWLSNYDADVKHGNKVRDISCLSNLKQIGVMYSQYREEHQGKLPPNLLTLTSSSGKNYVLQCPYSSDAVCYACVRQFPADPYAVLCYDKEPHHHRRDLFSRMPDTRNVLYADFHVKRLKESDFQKLGLSR